ncbi:MAG: hypothetical protein C4524_05845 [Candidatus Zixiibacteriota bacterium]|nr:MAG: hypothetical protein C4524_05845 [candidate division Zixibacteria bacterium]
MDFRGWDPWDALASPLLRTFPFTLRLPRWAANHLVKISPLNPRPLLGIPRDCFAKGVALFLSGYALRERLDPQPEQRDIIGLLHRRLRDKMIPGYSGPCWGTNVPYQTRAFYVPPQTPSLVHTAFAVEALLDLHDLQPQPQYLETAVGACRFALQDLNVRRAGEGLCFSYTPVDQTRVINVTALAARMLARTGRAAGDARLLDHAHRAMRYVTDQQAADGSWPYGEEPIHGWIDNYHTGFVLDSIEDYASHTGNDGIQSALLRGIRFYREHLFEEDGTPRFSPGSRYPLDGHCLAQGILTFTRLRRHDPEYLPFAERIAAWGVRHFRHPQGYYYFQIRRRWKNTIPHIRWVQAWMFLALNRLLEAQGEGT